MKNSGISFMSFLMLSILLVLSAAAAVWAYNHFNQIEKSSEQETLITLLPIGTDSISTAKVQNHTRDSLKKVFDVSVKNLEKNQKTAKKEILPPEDLNKLKTEISSILKHKNEDNYALAKQKINELQNKVNELTGKNSEIEKENKELYSMLRNYANERKLRNTEPVIKPIPAVFESKPSVAVRPEEKRPAPVQSIKAADKHGAFEVMNINLSAISVLDNKEEVTFHALRTDKFTGSFSMKNLSAQNATGEIIVVLLQPDGHVIQKSAWETGTFESSEGKKVYSCKMRFDYKPAEEKPITFSLDAGKCTKGNYSLLIYHKGKIAGRISKTLF